MKARDVSVGIQEVAAGESERSSSEPSAEYIVLVRFKLRGKPLEKETARPDQSQGYEARFGLRVKASAYKRKEKELRKILESVEF